MILMPLGSWRHLWGREAGFTFPPKEQVSESTLTEPEDADLGTLTSSHVP